MPQFDHIREFFPNGFHETDKEVSYQNLKYMAIGRPIFILDFGSIRIA